MKNVLLDSIKQQIKNKRLKEPQLEVIAAILENATGLAYNNQYTVSINELDDMRDALNEVRRKIYLATE